MPKPTLQISVTSDESPLLIESAHNIPHGDALRNINSYEYLKFIRDNNQIAFDAILPQTSEFFTNYDSENAYGDLYTLFLLRLEEACEDPGKYPSLRSDDLNKIVHDVFENNNLALERTAAMTKEVLDQTKHTSSAAEKKVTQRMAQTPPSSPTVNQVQPHLADSFGFKVLPMASAMLINETDKHSPIGKSIREKAKTGVYDFKPMTTTSQVSIRKYKHQTDSSPVELRMGTQAQYHQGEARFNPIFTRYLQYQQTQKKELWHINAFSDLPKLDQEVDTLEAADALEENIEKSKNRITHVYFNNLGLDSEGLSKKGRLERGFEYNLTNQLHNAEYNNPNLAVITLPADKGFLDKKLLTDKKRETAQNAFAKFLAVANGSSKESIQDFFISNKVQLLLYGKDYRGYVDETKRNEVLRDLLNKSFKKILGISDGATSTQSFSQAQLQAVYFHFIKYELTNFILEKLQPETFNTSCKDGIDRGGVSSAYYNLIKSIEKGAPLDEDEFYRALHAAPTLVKGRAMNHHTKLIWNAVDNYLAGNDKLPDSDPDKKHPPEWLITWRNKHVPEKMQATTLSDRWVSDSTTPKTETTAHTELVLPGRNPLAVHLESCPDASEKQTIIRDYLSECRIRSITPDLSGLDCSGLDLSRANLSGAKLTGANLTGVILTGANLTNITFDEKTIWKDIKEFKQVACHQFHFVKSDQAAAQSYEARAFIAKFNQKYAPPHRLTFLMGPKDTHVTRFINDPHQTNGSKLVYLFSHAFDKTRFLGQENNTAKALSSVLAESVASDQKRVVSQ